MSQETFAVQVLYRVALELECAAESQGDRGGTWRGGGELVKTQISGPSPGISDPVVLGVTETLHFSHVTW